MIGKMTTGIESLLSITNQPTVTKEVLEEHERLKYKFGRALEKAAGTRGRVGRALMEEEEVARANLRAFERRHGLT
jgi:hypothetical protein